MNQRNKAIVAAYADGSTLEEIGAEHDLTRERIRQIVRAHGGVDAEQSRAARTAQKDADRDAARVALLEEFEETARDLADRDVTRPRAVARIRALFPNVDGELLDEALRQSGIKFETERNELWFSDAVLEAGIWYLIGAELRLKPDPKWAAVHLDQILLDGLNAVLADVKVTDSEAATILGVIGASKRAAAERELTITGARYQELRQQLLDAMGLESSKGSSPWPATRQTLQKRYGGWNDALVSMGLGTARKGRAKGLVVFTESEYLAAVRHFLAEAAGGGLSTTFAAYEAWVLSARDNGIRRPSGASVRNFFGTWQSAQRTALKDAAGAVVPEPQLLAGPVGGR
ncbi:sigma factor-like helix-turn-helix DNA-binding protein [Microbacterium sp. NPDC088619]|uniref:sigma factor-like helix-turn-helix DNA-binding protein n=1 Tax=Microbacterium sp. NPDC088619 TaxID=3364196 RepID=UPI0038127CEB